MIITLEGAPAAGKSTICKSLVKSGVERIAEVNELFARPISSPPEWYFQRQIDRWSRAQAVNAKGDLAILDGDIFQPVWFNWMYPDRTDLGWHEILAYFTGKRNMIGLPNFYVYLWIGEKERRVREMNRSLKSGKSETDARAKVQRYNDMTGMESAYFMALRAEFPELVLIVEATSQIDVISAIRSHTPVAHSVDKVLAFLNDWLGNHDPKHLLSSAETKENPA